MEERDFDNLLSFDASFLAAAHELKTPLSIIRQLSLTLNDPKIEISKNDTSRILSQLDYTSERALRLVSDLTKVARLEDAMFKLEPINPRKVCYDIAEEMRQLYEIQGRKITVRDRKNTVLAVANYDLLRSIMLNLSDNALAASSKKSKVELGFIQRSGKVRIFVRDFSEDLPIKIWRNIKKSQGNFKPVSAASRPQSSGLGLFIAQNFAVQMGGKLGVIRHRNGSTFYVELNQSEQLRLV